MRLPAPIPNLTEHRRNRLMLWARVWLTWFTDWLLGAFGDRGAAAAYARTALDRMTRHVRELIFLNAIAQVRLPRRLPRSYASARRRRTTLRMLLGSRTRRALRMDGDVRQRLAALNQLAANPEQLIAALVKRLRTFTFRARYQIGARRSSEHIAVLRIAPRIACADTS